MNSINGTTIKGKTQLSFLITEPSYCIVCKAKSSSSDISRLFHHLKLIRNVHVGGGVPVAKSL